MPQKPIVRRRKKARRSKQLAAWREKRAKSLPDATPSGKPKAGK